MNTSETLWAARERVENGWCQNTLRNIHGDVCIIGALNDIRPGCSTFSPEFKALKQTLEELGYPTYGMSPSLIAFNDAHTTTKQDVLDLIEKTAIRLEKQGL